MASVNKVIILGHLGRDPELRYSTTGAAVCNVSVATSRSWKDKSSGDKVEETEWHRVVFYDRLAEVAGEFLKKGRPVYVEGRLKTRKWQDKEGRDVYTTEVIGESMQLLGGRDDGDGGQSRAPAPAPRQQSRASAPAPRQATGGARSGTGFDDMDDDIPFVTDCPSLDMSTGPARRMRRYAR